VSAQTKLSAVVITYNEEKKIDRCFSSLNWVDEIVIVDSFSTDNTVKICKKYGAAVYQHPWPGNYSTQRNIAIGHATNDWVLSLDADEIITKLLRDEIQELLLKGPDADAYGIPRQEYLGGRWITAGGFYPQYMTRLYRKSLGEWVNPLHERFVSRGRTKYLKNSILHDGAPTFKIFMDKFNYYSSVDAEADYKSGHCKFSLFRAIFKPLERFFGRFVKHRGYKDGIHGFYMAAVIAINYFLREMKIYEYMYMDAHKDSWEAVYRKTVVGEEDAL
jgi:glycosyltransferase involved in cell wall biosynthesis